MTTLSTTDNDYRPTQDCYRIVVGFRFGFSISTVIMTINVVFIQQDGAVAMGAIAQARTMGGFRYLHLYKSVSVRTIQTVLPEQLPFIRRVYSQGYRHQATALTTFSAVAFLVVFESGKGDRAIYQGTNDTI